MFYLFLNWIVKQNSVFECRDKVGSEAHIPQTNNLHIKANIVPPYPNCTPLWVPCVSECTRVCCTWLYCIVTYSHVQIIQCLVLTGYCTLRSHITVPFRSPLVTLMAHYLQSMTLASRIIKDYVRSYLLHHLLYTRNTLTEGDDVF